MTDKIDEKLDNITIAIFIVGLIFTGTYAHNYGHPLIVAVCVVLLFLMSIRYINNKYL